jgi:hypothetical protein
MLRSALLAAALLASPLASDAQTAQPVSTETRAVRPALDLPAFDARALRVAHDLFNDAGLAAAQASPDRRSRAERDLSTFAEAIRNVRGHVRSVYLVGSQVRPDGAVETFVQLQFEEGAEDLRVLWKEGHLATVQRGTPGDAYALSTEQ